MFRRRALMMTLLAAVSLGAGRGATMDAKASGAARWWAHVAALADDRMEGRDTGSAGERRAAEYVAAQFRAAGLQPVGRSTAGGTRVDDFFQPVRLRSRRVIEASSRIELVRQGVAEPQTLGMDVIVSPAVDPAGDLDAPLVFVGYGLRVAEVGYDDLADVDVRGAVVVRMAGGPSAMPGPLKAHYQSTAELVRGLVDAGAIGVVTIVNPRTPAAYAQAARIRLQEATDLAEPGLGATEGLRLALTVNPTRAERWLAGSGHTLDDLTSLLEAGERLPRFRLGASLRARVRVERRDLLSQNVVGVLPGADPASRDEYVLLCAHLDHLGIGEPVDGDRIYNGAFDNAAGVATLLEIAQHLSEARDDRPARSLIFLATTGEERGLLGSRFFAGRPPIDLARVAAAINCDMFLPIHPLRVLTAFGMDESDLGDVARQVALASQVAVQDDPLPQRGTFVRSDQYSFVRKGIPSLMVGIGAESGSADERLQHAWFKSRYHAPSDDLRQPVDFHAAAAYNRLVLQLIQALGQRDARPRWRGDSFFRRFAERSD